MKLKEKLLKALKENGIVPKYYLNTEYDEYHFYFEDEDESVEIVELFDELTEESADIDVFNSHEDPLIEPPKDIVMNGDFEIWKPSPIAQD